jgi:hypothetical protein
MVTAAILGNLISGEGKTILMTKKKKARKKRNRPRKGVMPPALRKYWAKKRAKKNSRKKNAVDSIGKAERRRRKSAMRHRWTKELRRQTKRSKKEMRASMRAWGKKGKYPETTQEWFNPRRRRPNRKRTRPLKRAKSMLLSELRKAGYAIAPKANRRRRRKANRRRKAKRNPPRSIRIPGTVTTKQRRAIGRFLARSTGRRIVYKKAGRR